TEKLGATRLMKRAKLIGTCESRWVLPPASSSRTRKRPFSVRRLASAEPADPAPTMTKSTVRLPPAGSAAPCANVTVEDAGCRGGRGLVLCPWHYPSFWRDASAREGGRKTSCAKNQTIHGSLVRFFNSANARPANRPSLVAAESSSLA